MQMALGLCWEASNAPGLLGQLNPPVSHDALRFTSTSVLCLHSDTLENNTNLFPLHSLSD